MIVLYHRGGPAPCGQPALGLRRAMSMPRHDLPADNVVKLDGTTPVRGEAVLCGACGQPLHPQWLFTSPEAQVIHV